MKWIGKKKKRSMKKPTSSTASSAASSSHSSFTKSWISKFKQIRDKPTTTPVHNHPTNFYSENYTATIDSEKLIKSNPYSNPTCSLLLPVNSMFEQQHEFPFIQNGDADKAGYRDREYTQYIDNLPFGFQRMSFKDDDGDRCRSRELTSWGRSQTNHSDDNKLYGKGSIESNGRPVEEETELLMKNNNNKKKKREEDHRSPRFMTPTSVCLRNKTPTRDDNHLPTYHDQVTSTLTTPELREFFKTSLVSSIHDNQNSASLHLRSNHFQVKGRYEKSPHDDDVAGSMSNRNFLQATVTNSTDKKVEEEEEAAAAAAEWERLKNAKLHEYKSRSNEQRKSVYIQGEKGWSDSKLPKEKQGNLHFKVGRPCSPKIVTKKEAVCRIKPLEDMKKAVTAATQTRNKKKQISNGKQDNTSVSQEMDIGRVIGRVDHQLESCAVAKTSVNPGEDFKASMMEMIAERGIRGPQELEELLACYLALNSDEYHHVIIRVFRQVWSELDGLNLTVASSRGR